MNITCERPYVFFALLIIIPVFILLNTRHHFSFRKMVFVRSLFISLSVCMILLAYA